jgi:uncharacterized protein (TIGR03083 family)
MIREPNDLDARASAWGVEPVLAALAETDATSPPSSIRVRLLERVAQSPRILADPVLPGELYTSRVDELRSLLDDLTAEDWSCRAEPYEWTVHGLVAHLLVIELYSAALLGLGEAPNGDANDHLALGADVITTELAGTPGDTARRWSATAQTIIDHVRSDRFDPQAPMQLHQWPFSASSGLVARGFELWTHTDDIRRATGRTIAPISAGELRTMSSFSVSTLPFMLGSVAPGLTMQPTRVVLTGAGGGTFDIGGIGERGALVVTDVVDCCRTVARRIEPGDLERTVEGDSALVDGLLEASRVFAV